MHDNTSSEPRSSRDRDVDGRARQARPRDVLGRPLPYGSPGVVPFDDRPLSPLDAIETARAYLTEGRAFAAHEVFEGQWKARPPEERELWQGLAQLCVAVTHTERGNLVGATTLLGRSTQNLRSYTRGPGATYGLDVVAILEQLDAGHSGEDLSVLKSVLL